MQSRGKARGEHDGGGFLVVHAKGTHGEGGKAAGAMLGEGDHIRHEPERRVLGVYEALGEIRIAGVGRVLQSELGAYFDRGREDGARAFDDFVGASEFLRVRWWAVFDADYLSVAAATYDWRSPVGRMRGTSEARY